MNNSIRKTALLVIVILLTAQILHSQTFTEQTSVTLPGVSNGSAAWGDYDNDGDQDIILSGIEADNTVLLKIFNNTAGTFSEVAGAFSPDPNSISSSWTATYKADWVDFDNDNKLDVIACGPAASGCEISVYRNTGIGFTRMFYSGYLTFQGGSSFDCSDFDNDGDIDILLSNSVETKILRNKGSFVFADVSSIVLPGLQYSSAKFFDYDNDGDPDIALSGQFEWTSNSYVFRNDGYDSFTQQNTTLGVGYIDAADYNNDGKPDILIAGNSGIYRNNGDNTFSNQAGISLPYTNNGCAKWGDLDNDGDNDIVISGNSITKIYLNNGNNTFTELQAGLAGLTESFVAVGDYDSDGDLDILIGGTQGPGRLCKLYKNGSTVINTPPAQPGGVTNTLNGNDVILSWNPVTTDNTPAASMSYNIMVGTTTGSSNTVNPNANTTTGYYRKAATGNAQMGTTFVLRNLKKDQAYYWKVQAVDNSFKGGAFSTEGTFTYTPRIQSYGLSVPDKGAKECSLEWNRGNWTSCIVFMKAGSSGTFSPAGSYTASTVFNPVYSGWACVYKGTGTSVHVTGLNAKTNYIFQVIEFDGGTVYSAETGVNNPFTFLTGQFTEINAGLAPVANYSLLSTQMSSSYWFDYDNDNDLDLFMLGASAAYLYINTAGSFASVSIPFYGGYCASMGDYDNDGYIDIALNGNTGIYRNVQADPNHFVFQSSLSIPGVYYGPVAWNDYDNDGDLDFVITGDNGGDTNVSLLFRQNADGSFTNQGLVELDQVGYGMVKWGDYDNDGFNDMVISGGTNEAVEVTSLYKNNGTGGFVKQTNANLAGATSSSIDWADYDADGDQDLLVGDFGTTTLYRNDGNNTFTAQTGINLMPTGYGSVQWGDYDNDGDPDILLAGFTSDYRPLTKIYRNNGDSTFTEDTNSILPGAGFGSATFGDYDNDNDLDIIVEGIDADKTFSKIFRNDISTPNIKPAAPSGSANVVSKSDVTLSWTAVKTDNTSDKSMSYNIMVGTVSGGIDVMSPHSNTTTGYRRLTAPGNAYYDTKFYLKNLPIGTYYWRVQAVDNSFAGSPFSPELSFQVVPVQASNLSAKIIDRNSLQLNWERGNGDRCVVFCKQASSGTAVPSNSTGYIADPEFGYGTQLGSTGWYCVFNGRADSVIVTGLVYQKEYSFHVIEYTGSYGSENYFTNVVNGNPGVFTSSLFAMQAGIILPTGADSPAAWGDYDNDGDPDLLIPANPTRIYRNNGDNTFTALGTVLPAIFFGSAEWGDYDNDNDLDFIISGATTEYPASSPVIRLYRNDGSGIFTEQANSFQAVYYSSIEWYDYNGDGYIDLLITGATGNDPNFNPLSKVYKNNGNGTFTVQAITLTGVWKGDARWGDYDNDGDPDIALGGVLDYNEGHNILKIYRNNGNNSFTEQNTLAGYPKMSVSWGDCDKDGDLELLISSYFGVLILQQDPDGMFQKYSDVNYPAFQDAPGVEWCDYDNDGYLDIIATKPGLNTEIYRNTFSSGGTFMRQDDESFSSTGYRFISTADYDNDGDIDFVLSKSGMATVVFRNNLIMKSGLFKINAPPARPLSPSAENRPEGVVLTWLPANDDITPPSTMTYNLKIGTATDLENITSSNSAGSGFRKIPAMGNLLTDNTYLLKNMPAGKYYWKLQAVDQGYKGGTWQDGGSFDVRNVQAFFSATEVCNGKPTAFTDESVATAGITAWKWYFSDGTTSISRNPVHTYAQSGTYTVKLEITDATGKKDTIVHAVNVKPKPVAAFDAPSVCEGTAVTIINKTITDDVEVATWTWDFGDESTSSEKIPGSHPYLEIKDYNITLEVVATNGCKDSIIKTVSVVSRPQATITVAGSASFCEGKSVTLSTVKNNQYTYLWTLDDNAQTGGNGDSFVANTAGKYTVTISNPKGNCHSTSDTINVEVKPSPAKPSIQPQNYKDGQCPGENPVKLGTTNIQGYNYKWMMNGIILPNETSSYIEFYEPGNFRLIAEINGCQDTSVVFTANFPQGPEKPKIYAEGPSAWYLASSVMNAKYYKWYYNGSLVEGADKYYYMADKNLGVYRVSVGDVNGCYTKSDSLAIPLIYTDIDDSKPIEGLHVYPNPSDGIVYIEFENNYTGKVKAEVFTQSGKKVISKEFEKPEGHFREAIDMAGQAKGMYLVNIKMNGYTVIKKILIN